MQKETGTIEKANLHENLLPPEEESQAAFQDSFEHYGSSRGVETIAAHYDLLEALPGDNETATEHPAMTMCIPLAINREDPETISTALDALANAQKHFGKDVDVVIWANARYAEEADQTTTTETAQANYSLLRDELAKRDDEGVHIRTALQVLPAEEATMSKLRANYMDAVAMDVGVRELGYEHPVMWLDADISHLGGAALAKTNSIIRSFDVLFAHPVEQYSAAWAAGQKLGDLDATTKSIVIQEIERRQLSRNYMAGYMEPNPYFEESGTAFAIGTYLELGGVNTNVAVSESPLLIAKIDDYLSEKDSRGNVMLGGTHSLDHLLPEFIRRHKKTEPVVSWYMPGTTITTVARRQRERVEREGPEVLHKLDTNYTGLFTDIDWNESPVKVTEEEFNTQLQNEDFRREGDRRRTEDQRKVTKMLQRRLFPDA